MEQNYETKIGNILYCPKCKKPMGKRKEKGTFQIRKFSDGKPHNIGIALGNNYEPFKFFCEDCDAGHIFVQFGGDDKNVDNKN